MQISIEHETEQGRLVIEVNRERQQVEIIQYYPDESNAINLTVDEAYQLMTWLKTAIEVKL